MRFTMKRDGRTLDHATLESIRKMAVQRVHEGERPSAVISSFGMHRCTIYGWLKAVRGRGHGLKALAAKPASGTGTSGVSLDQRQEPAAIRVRLWPVDAPDRPRSHRAAFRRDAESG